MTKTMLNKSQSRIELKPVDPILLKYNQLHNVYSKDRASPSKERISTLHSKSSGSENAESIGRLTNTSKLMWIQKQNIDSLPDPTLFSIKPIRLKDQFDENISKFYK